VLLEGGRARVLTRNAIMLYAFDLMHLNERDFGNNHFQNAVGCCRVWSERMTRVVFNSTKCKLANYGPTWTLGVSLLVSASKRRRPCFHQTRSHT